jgi:hypothetical protein
VLAGHLIADLVQAIMIDTEAGMMFKDVENVMTIAGG